MSKDKRDPSREELIRKIAGEIDMHYPNVMCASEAALDIALKAAAGIAGGWKSSLRPGSQDRLSGHLEARRDIADAILALTSEGVKE